MTEPAKFEGLLPRLRKGTQLFYKQSLIVKFDTETLSI